MEGMRSYFAIVLIGESAELLAQSHLTALPNKMQEAEFM